MRLALVRWRVSSTQRDRERLSDRAEKEWAKESLEEAAAKEMSFSGWILIYAEFSFII